MNKDKLTREQIKDTGTVFGLIMLIAGFYSGSQFWYKIAFITILLALLAPLLFKYPARYWFVLSEKLGSVVSMIVLSIIYFLIVIPVSFVRKSLKKDPMMIRSFKISGQTGWIERKHKYSPADLNKPF
jgi:hypothetical protein